MASSAASHSRATGEELPMHLIDAETERLILSNILSRRDDFGRHVLPQLSIDHFAVERHRRVFRFICEAVERGHDPDLAGVYRQMLDLGKRNRDLGLPVLSELAWDNSMDLINPERWISALKRKSIERQAWRAAEKLRQGIEFGDDPAEEITAARERLRKLEADYNSNTKPYTTISDMIERMEGGPGALFSGTGEGVGTPFHDLTRLTNGGPRPGQFWLVGARPSLGKTTVGLQIALHVAAKGKPALFVSLEMSEIELLKRLVALSGAIDHSALVRGNLDAYQRHAVMETVNRIAGFPLTITAKVRTLAGICAEIAKGKSGRPYELVVIDYLGLIEVGGRYETRNLEVSAMSRRLKLAAMDAKIPIVALHQLNRAPDTQDRRPQLADLRDSGTLEQDADTVVLLDTPVMRKKGDAPKDATDLLIAKQRNGPRGLVVNLRFEQQYCRLVEFEGAGKTGGTL